MHPQQEGHLYRFDGFTIDAARRLLHRDGQPVSLNPKAFDLLVVLVENRGRIMTKEQLLQKVWPDQFVEEGNLTVHMSAVRKALGDGKTASRFVVTIPGRGYKFVSDVSEAPDTGLVIEQHTLSRLVVEQEEGYEDEVLNAAASAPGAGILTDAAGLSAPAVQRDLSIAPSADSQVRPAVEVFQTSQRAGILIGAGVLLCLLIVSAVAYLLYSRGKKPGAGQRAGGRGMTSKQLTALGGVGSAALSSDGKFFAYAENLWDGRPGGLWLGHTNGGNPIQLRPPEFYGYIAFAPNGGSIFYQSHGSLFQMPALGGAPQKVLDRIPVRYSLAPDGKRVAFLRDDGDRKLSAIMVADLETGEEHEVVSLPQRAGFCGYPPGWSPDGSMLAIGAASPANPNQFVLMSVQVADGAMRQLNPQGWDEISRVTWLHDGSGILFRPSGAESNYRIWLLDYPAGEERCITPGLSRFGRDSLSVSSDGSALIGVKAEETCSVWVGPAGDVKQSRQVTGGSFGRQDGYDGLAWTPDGKIVYVSLFNSSSSLWMMNPDGSEARQITPSGFIDKFPRVTSDGRYIVFESNRGGSSEIWRVNADGSDLRRLTDGGGNSSPDVTLDSKSVLYVRTEDGATSIWKMGIDGDEPVQLIRNPSDLPKVSPDGTMLACAYFDKAVLPRAQLAVLSLADGSLLYHFDLGRYGTFNNGLHWSPNGSAVTYRDFTGGVWRQPLAGGAPEKVPEIPNKRIFYFDWSPDGREFAMAYGEEVRDVVLINNFR